ncbi:hypothetical protein [Pyxidicoccus xibeiensis]|uniref:hypothetical protein n=1 Tax=Pyxidicoccus xibeiensis TaxID=2906759 RepID=UPI0020A6EE29|nr:hypothetical protein [Pyxidicoccus xibeiensis]MCP3136586.1 hypothetical protein [Pyxidicoccus xibeiensis]
MTGKYDVTGTMTLEAATETSEEPIEDMVRISSDTNANNKALRLSFSSLGCGPRATMTGETSFLIIETACPLPPVEECTSELVFTQGNGLRGDAGALELSVAGAIEVTCDGRTSGVGIRYELNGTRTAASLPGTHEAALTATGTNSLLERARQAALR